MYEIGVFTQDKKGRMGNIGEQIMGANNTNGSNITVNSQNRVNFLGMVNDLEDEVNETRKELNFLNKEV